MNAFPKSSCCAKMKSTVASQYLTAMQLERLLRAFNSDLSKLDAAKAAAPRLVNPSHALGLAQLFNSSLSQQDFTRTIAAQR